MRRLQISIDAELDDELGRAAREQGVSKAEIVRRSLRESIKPLPPIEEDPIWDIVGMGEGLPDDSRSVDDIVYGPRE